MSIFETLKDHEMVIDFYESKINDDNYQDVLSDIYNYVKSVSDVYYMGCNMDKAYSYLMKDIIRVEEKLSDLKLLDVPVYFNSSDNKDNFMDFIVHSVRKHLIEKVCFKKDYCGDISDVNFTNYCYYAAGHIEKLCRENNEESYILPIYPGYEEKARLYNGSGYHFANVIKRNNKYYLVDATYSQFFYQMRNNLDRIGVVNLSGCSAGVFMLMSDEGKNIAKNLIQDGYIELNEEIFKTYLDSFSISFRNGLYYEKTNDFSYTSTYSVDDYIKFFHGRDNQINHEGQENLGYQKKPLKNSELKFRR